MISKNKLFLIGSLLFCITFFAQKKNDSLVLKFNLKWRNEPLELDKNYISKTDTLQITKLKFYISNVELQFTDNSKYKDKKPHLIDIENSSSLSIALYKKTYKTISKINFNIGIDSLNSVSGALSGDLDPTKGMYWAWQSGYINMKIEGKSSSCSTRKNEFHFHLGGYLKPNYALRNVEIQLDSSSISAVEVPIIVDLSKMFDQIKLVSTNTIMTPCNDAMKIADMTTKLFSVK